MERQSVAIEILATLLSARQPGPRIRRPACLFFAALALVLFALQFTVAAQGPDAVPLQKKYAQEYYQSFKGTPDDMQGFRFGGRQEAADGLRYEPNGLRITYPLGYAGGRALGIGLQRDFRIKGDFEITIRFEILKDPEQAEAEGMGARVTLGATLDTPERYEGSVYHKTDGKGAIQFATFLMTPKEGVSKGKSMFNFFPAKEKIGRLRLVRAGSLLAYYASDGTNDNFTLLKECLFDPADVKLIYISTSTDGPLAELEVRVTDLLIRSESVQMEHAITALPPQRTARWMLAGLFALGLIIGGFWIWWRKSVGFKEEETAEE